EGFGSRMAYAWGSLLSAVRTGKPAYHAIFSRPFWADLDAHPDLAASFDAMMGPAGLGVPYPDVLIEPSWASVRTVVDVGCGAGARAASPALLVMVLLGGRDRSLADFRVLAREAGLEVAAAAQQPSGRFVVECRPV